MICAVVGEFGGLIAPGWLALSSSETSRPSLRLAVSGTLRPARGGVGLPVAAPAGPVDAVASLGWLVPSLVGSAGWLSTADAAGVAGAVSLPGVGVDAFAAVVSPGADGSVDCCAVAATCAPGPSVAGWLATG